MHPDAESPPTSAGRGETVAVVDAEAVTGAQVASVQSRKPAKRSKKPAKPTGTAAKPTGTAVVPSKKPAKPTGTAAEPIETPAQPIQAPIGPLETAAATKLTEKFLGWLFGGSDAPRATSEVAEFSKDNPAADFIELKRSLGFDVSRWDFEQLTTLMQEAREYRRELKVQDAQAAAKQRQLDAEVTAKENEYKLATRETHVRFAIALILVVGAVTGVFVGIIKGLDAAAVAQYLAPITGLAGIAVGYFFGRASQ